MNSDRRRHRSSVLLCLLAVALLTSGCSRAPDPVTDLQDVSLDAAVLAATVSETADEESRAVQADETNLMRQWARNCALCHVRGEGGAPRIGDVDNWRDRVAQGEGVLLTHTIEGLNNMPPLGYCMDCESADFAALIRFMAGAALSPATHHEEAQDT